MKFYNNSDISVMYKWPDLTVTRFSEESFNKWNCVNITQENHENNLMDNYGINLLSRGKLYLPNFFVGREDFGYVVSSRKPKCRCEKSTYESIKEQLNKVQLFLNDVL